jgi:hypothetical protein
MAVVIAAEQFIHQLLQTGCELGLRTQALLQPFADGIADRSCSPVINLFEIVVDSAIHNEFQHRF